MGGTGKAGIIGLGCAVVIALGQGSGLGLPPTYPWPLVRGVCGGKEGHVHVCR